MKIGFVLSQPFGKSVGTDVRNTGLIRGLSESGIDVHIITPFSDSPCLSGKNIYVHQIEPPIKIPVNTYRLTKSVDSSSLFRKLLFSNKFLMNQYISRASDSIYKISSNLGLDILQAEQPLASAACVKLRNRLSIPVIADFHAVWCEELVASNSATYEDAFYKTIFDLERDIAQYADAVTVVGEEMKDYVIHSFGAKEGKIIIVPNATFPKTDHKFVPPEHPLRVIYSGTLHQWERVELFVQSMPFVLKKLPLVEFNLTRKGAKLKNIMQLADSLRVNPNFFWFNNSSDLFDFLGSCHVGVLSSTAHIARKMAYPAKLYDYLSVGLPMVANDIGAWTKMISDYKIGIVTGNSPEEFAEGILTFLENPRMRREYGERGLELVREDLNFFKSAERLIEIYKKLT